MSFAFTQCDTKFCCRSSCDITSSLTNTRHPLALVIYRSLFVACRLSFNWKTFEKCHHFPSLFSYSIRWWWWWWWCWFFDMLCEHWSCKTFSGVYNFQCIFAKRPTIFPAFWAFDSSSLWLYPVVVVFSVFWSSLFDSSLCLYHDANRWCVTSIEYFMWSFVWIMNVQWILHALYQKTKLKENNRSVARIQCAKKWYWVYFFRIIVWEVLAENEHRTKMKW